ncbi:hypothetical protein SSYM_2568, partial [Serratia symbiotica str. Tucson]
KPHCRTYSNN